MAFPGITGKTVGLARSRAMQQTRPPAVRSSGGIWDWKPPIQQPKPYKPHAGGGFRIPIPHEKPKLPPAKRGLNGIRGLGWYLGQD